jgi:hypothetical protein
MGFIGRLRARMKGNEESDARADVSEPKALPKELLWLLDAPMFIDDKQVEAFYDAVLRPDTEGASLTLSDTITKGRKVGAETSVEAAIPWLTKGGAKVSGELGRERAKGEETTYEVVRNPYRHLLALAMHYCTEQEERLVFRSSNVETGVGENADDQTWLSDEFIQASPRALAFLDLGPGSKLIPAAMELSTGETVTLFDRFAAKLESPTDNAPGYPGSRAPTEDRTRYWNWFAQRYDEPAYKADRHALDVVEDAVTDAAAIRWIAFRVPLVGTTGPVFLHLHIALRGQYETAAVGYNFISRGYKHGLRLVGTLKSEPDMNVLAIFER